MVSTNDETGRRPSRRGFAAMDPERRREIARRGGASVPSEKRSFAQDRDLAANAGRKGGAASRGGGPGSAAGWVHHESALPIPAVLSEIDRKTSGWRDLGMVVK